MANTAVTTTGNTALTNGQQQRNGIATYLGSDAVRANIAGVIGEKNVTRFISSVVSAVQINPTLAACTNGSILSAALQGEALQLAPSPQLGQFYMVPYDKKGKVNGKWETVAKEAQFQIGYKGYIQLAVRSGQYRKIVVSEIKEGECEYNPITEEMALHPIMNPAEREKTPTIGYYAMFELMNGFRKELFSPKESVEAHAKKYSSAYRYDMEKGKKSSVWTTDFDSMAKKTLIRQLIGKWGIMSVEMQQAYEKDMAVIEEDGTARYIDNTNAVDVETQVQQDIALSANSVPFPDEEDTKVGSVPKQTKQQESVPEKVFGEVVEDDDSIPDFMKG